MLAAYYRTFAQTYGGGVYGQSTYQTTTANGNGGGLSNTGIAVASIVTLAALILLVALVVRIWRRPGTQVPLEAVQDTTRDNEVDRIDERDYPSR